jgi:tyrosinase
LKNRINDISGPIINFDYGNELGGNITLDDVIYIGETFKLETTIREVMHIQRGPLCYDYDELY